VTLRARLTWLYAAVAFVALVSLGAGVGLVVRADLLEDAAERAAAGLPPEGLDPGQRQLLWLLGVGLPLALAGAGAGGWWIAGRALRPLDEIARVARAISANDLGRRLPSGGGAEVAQLAGSLNQLFARLERSLESSRRFTADAAHELRTPLTATMGRLEVALRHPAGEADLRDAIGAGLEELARLKSLLEGLLLLSRSDCAQLAPGDRVALVDLAELAGRLVERDRAFAEERAISIELARAPAFVRGDARLLERAIGNLLANALIHGRPGGRVALTPFSDGRHAGVAVEDDGPGVPEAERARLFERFFRGRDAERTEGGAGFGLGLSIARAVAEAHRGSVRFQPRAGGGSIFTVELPAA
jgi:signal transduction histidine kinase